MGVKNTLPCCFIPYIFHSEIPGPVTLYVIQAAHQPACKLLLVLRNLTLCSMIGSSRDVLKWSEWFPNGTSAQLRPFSVMCSRGWGLRTRQNTEAFNSQDWWDIRSSFWYV